MTETIKASIIWDVDLSKNLKELLFYNSDVKITKELKAKILSIDDNDILLIKREIGYPNGIKICKVDSVTEEFLKKELI